MVQTEAKSILAVEIGTAFTKAALFDVVDGRRRFVARGQAPSSLFAPNPDVARGVVMAVQQVEAIVGREILSGQVPAVPERSNGRGVDASFILSSAGRTLRVLVIGTTTALTNRLATEAAAVPEVAMLGCLGLDAKVARGESRMGRILNALQQEPPDVLVVGDGDGTRTGLAELAQAVGISIRSDNTGLSVVFLGDDEGAAVLQRAVPDANCLHHLPPGPAQTGGVTALQERLQFLWQSAWVETVPGAANLDAWSQLPLHSTRHGFGNALRFLAGHEKIDVWGLDVGGASSTAIAIVGGSLTTTGREVGVGSGCLSLLHSVPALAQWLVANPDGVGLADAVLGKHLHPWAVPETKEQLALDGALVRVVGAGLLDALPVQRTHRSKALLVGRGATISSTPSDGHAALLLLDTFQPVGLVELALDELDVTPMLGVAACQVPRAAAELLSSEGLRRLAPCIAIGGSAKDDTVAAKITVERAGQKVHVNVPFGKIKVLPLEEGETAKVTVKPSGKLDCGEGPGAKASYTLKGGPLGLVIDARARPIVPANLRELRASRLAEWREALGG